MSNTETQRGRTVFYRNVLDSDNVNGYIDLELDVSSQVVLNGSEPTGLENDSTTYTMDINVGGTLSSVSVVGSAAQTIDQLRSEIDDDLSGAECLFLETEKVLRIRSTSSGNVAVAVQNAGNLPSSLKGTPASPIRSATFKDGVSGGGVAIKVSNTASTTNPVNAAYTVEVRDSNGAARESVVTYDSTKGILLIRDDGSDEFAAGDVIAANVVIFD